MKSAPIIKEPKREKLSWSDDDSRDGWNDRLFLEGFYEVDSTVNDWEREKRMSQVERSLKEIEKRKRKSENPPGVILSGGQRPNPNAVRAPFGRGLTGQSGTFTRLPGTPNAPMQITKLPYYGGRYPAYTNYANVANKNAAASKSGDATRPPTKEEMQAAYADMQNRFSGRYTGQHLNDAAEYVTNAATPQNNTQRKTQTATTTSTAQTQSRDARVRENYRARQQAEADARYENFDIEAAEEKLRDNDYWTDRLLESRRQGYGFAGDEQIAEERNALEQEIENAKVAAERRRERYIREKAAQMPERKPGDMLRWSAENPTFNANASQKELHKVYYNEDRSIYGTVIDELLTKQTPSLPEISGKDVISKIPFQQAKYPYTQRALDELTAQPHTTKELSSLAREAMHNDEIPVISGTKNITIGKAKVPMKVPNVSGKAVSTFAGEAINIAGYIWDAQEIMSAVSADLKADGQIGKDTAKATAKVAAGNIGGAVAGWAAGQVMSKTLALAGTAVNPLLGVALAVGGEFLAAIIAENLIEEATESLFQ